MSSDSNWNPDKYREDHESDEHWELRKAFMERWKNDYPEERLVCLARVFTNMEFMGCRYPPEIMHEVAGLSHEVAKAYRNLRKTKLQRTFVSASTAAEDRAKGVKREGGIVNETPPSKSTRIDFVAQGQKVESDNEEENDNDESDDKETKPQENKSSSEVVDANEYMNDMLKIQCLNVRQFQDRMFNTDFGRMVLLIRPWASKFTNIMASCQACGVKIQSEFENGFFSVTMNGKLIARATGGSKLEAKSIVETMAWNRLKKELVSIVMKEQWIAHNGARISVNDVTGRRSAQDNFGTPLDSSVASKMMKMMGWKGGGLGADAQGIAEPIQPNMQMVNRAGLGSSPKDINNLKRAAHELMRRYIASESIDVDLVFSSEFNKEERAALHQCAMRHKLASKSYGTEDSSPKDINNLKRAAHELMRRYIASESIDVDLVFSSEFNKEEHDALHQCAMRHKLASKSYGTEDRFLVVKKKIDPFSLARAIIDKGGVTEKYQVFIPAGLGSSR